MNIAHSSIYTICKLILWLISTYSCINSFDNTIFAYYNHIMRESNTNFLNIMKFMMSIFVMIVHFSPFKSIDPILHFISIHGFTRVAVPFFVLSAGYFVSNNGKIGIQQLSKTLKKLLYLYLFWTMVYLPLIIIEFDQLGHQLTLLYIVQRFVFKGTFFHLWYFAAIALSIVLIYIFQQVFSLKSLFFLSLILYVIGALNDSYYYLSTNFSLLESLSNVLQSMFYGVRNGLFYTPIFVVIGIMMKNMKQEIKLSHLILSVVLTSFLLLAEISLIRYHSWALDYNITFSILPFSVIIFIISLRINYPHKTNQFKEMAATIFYTHILFYVFVQLAFFKRNIETFRTYGFYEFLITTLITIVFALLIQYFKKIRLIKKYFIYYNNTQLALSWVLFIYSCLLKSSNKSLY